jgi:hypothetical protein
MHVNLFMRAIMSVLFVCVCPVGIGVGIGVGVGVCARRDLDAGASVS